MNISIDPARCTGHGRCYSVAPAVFDSDDAGLGLVRPGAGDRPDLAPAAELGRASCPEQAITTSD